MRSGTNLNEEGLDEVVGTFDPEPSFIFVPHTAELTCELHVDVCVSLQLHAALHVIETRLRLLHLRLVIEDPAVHRGVSGPVQRGQRVDAISPTEHGIFTPLHVDVLDWS